VADIVRNLLQFSRQEKQVPTAHAVQEIVEDTLLLIRSILKSDQIQLLMDLNPDLPRVVCCKQHIQQVLINLITNSRDALNGSRTEHETKRIELTASLLKSKELPMVRLSVADNGGGIAPEVLPKIFDPFFTTKSLAKGTGLGLAISHGIVEAHGGAITVENTPHTGCTFHVDLPAEDTNPKSNDTPKHIMS
jgi:signal transduction histidine kinase